MTQAQALRAARNRGLNLISASFVFSIFVNLLMLTGPLFMLQVYDRVLGSRSEETLAALFVLVAFLYMMMSILEFARGRLMARFGAKFQSSMDPLVFDAALTAEATPGISKTAKLRDLESIQSVFASPVILAIMDLPWSPLFIAGIFIFHPMLGWLAVAGATTLLVLTLVNQIVTHKKVQRANGLVEHAQNMADQAQSASEVVRSQGMRTAVRTRWGQQRNAALSEKISSNDWTGSFTSFTKSFRLFLQSAMLGVGAYYVLQGQMTAGAMIAGSILLGRALQPIEQSLGQWSALQRARQAWVALNEALEEQMMPQPPTPLPVPEARIDVENITYFSDITQPPLLKQISFSVAPGTAVGVIGKSGSGKTTLARALLGLLPLATGQIRLGGASLNQYDPDVLGQHIGYLPQSVRMMSGTVAENIARMSLEADPERIVAAAQAANAHDMIVSLPQGYDTFIDGDANTLSGGQNQRIALARALYADPQVMILDEPNSALDLAGSEALNRTISAFKKAGRAVIVMTHRPMAISECDQLVILKDGAVHDMGPRDEIAQRHFRNAAQVMPVKPGGGANAPKRGKRNVASVSRVPNWAQAADAPAAGAAAGTTEKEQPKRKKGGA
ncbi:MAG: type I secretion system permease/ATPase [Pseudomonadota bacterium]